jgi:hypothetical protein
MVEADAFKDWNALQDIYLKPTVQHVKANHIFVVDIHRNKGNLMWLFKSNGSVETEHKMVKLEYVDNDDAFWQGLQPDSIAPVGLQDIKWKELHSKWRKYVPTEKKPEWKYYIEEPPKEKIAAVAKQSKQARLQRKDCTRTVHDRNKNPEAKKAKLDTDKDNKEEPIGNTGVI